MRMWMVDPQKMCRQHLLGEHNELHMLAGSLIAGRSIAGHLADGQLEPASLERRHKELVTEMRKRGYTHQSPLPKQLPKRRPEGRVDVKKAEWLLALRCSACLERMQALINEVPVHKK